MGRGSTVLEGFLTKALTVKNLDEDEDEPNKKPGVLTQYYKAGDGYVATTDTVKTLPPDCYKLSITPNGEVVFLRQNIVTDDLLRLPDSKSEEVITEIEKFWTLKSKFKQYGFSHKRGFLLHGPPGSGKTSTLSIVMKDMVKTSGIVIVAQDPALLGIALMNFRRVELERPLVVIWEDIDAVVHRYGESEVLAILDGESQVENVVFIASTNYPEDLDGRIINRPSRFDKVVQIGMPNKEARALYIQTKIKETVKDGIDLVTATEGMSIAHIKELIVSVYCQGNGVEETVKRLKDMKVQPTSKKDMQNGYGIGLR